MSLRDKVESSNIDSMEYDAGRRTVRVEFKGRDAAWWDYPHVLAEEYDEVLHPGAGFGYSVGRAFALLIKGPHGREARKVSFLQNGVRVMLL